MNLFSKNNSIFHQMIYTTEMISKHLKINSIIRKYLKGRKCLRRDFLSKFEISLKYLTQNLLPLGYPRKLLSMQQQVTGLLQIVISSLESWWLSFFSSILHFCILSILTPLNQVTWSWDVKTKWKKINGHSSVLSSQWEVNQNRSLWQYKISSYKFSFKDGLSSKKNLTMFKYFRVIFSLNLQTIPFLFLSNLYIQRKRASSLSVFY